MTRPSRAVLVLVALTLATCLSFELRGRVPFTSDQAVVGIMANDIRERGVHPVFFYGSEYAGTLEPHYVAVAFSLFGSSRPVFRAAMAFLVVLTVLTVWAVTRAALGARAGLIAGLYLAVGPSFFLYKGLSSDGPYASLLLLSAASVWLIVGVERRFAESRPPEWHLLALGGVMGLAWWVHSASAFLGPVVAAGALAGTTRRWLAPSSLARLLLGFAAGSLPWWARNIETGMASLTSPEMAPAASGNLAAQAQTLFTLGWSTLLGARSAWSSGPTFPGATLLALALLAGALVFGFRCARGPVPAARQGAVVFATAVIALSAACLAISRTDFFEPRFLFAGYCGLAPLIGGAVDALWRFRAARIVVIAVVAALNLGSQAQAPRMRHHNPAHPLFGDFDLTRVEAALTARGVRSLYAPYWTAYKLTFLSRERLLASPLGEGTNGMARVTWLREAVDSDPNAAFLLSGDDLQRFQAFLGARGIHREALDGFVLFTGTPKVVLRTIRACQCIPEVLDPREIALLDAEGPSGVRADTVATYRVRVRNGSLHRLSNNVRLSYHWLRAEGSVAVWDGERSRVTSWPEPGNEAVIEIGVRANVPPGEYRVAFDVVCEKVDWLSSSGQPFLERQVTVEAASPP